jgi:hypothetical protein
MQRGTPVISLARTPFRVVASARTGAGEACAPDDEQESPSLLAPASRGKRGTSAAFASLWQTRLSDAPSREIEAFDARRTCSPCAPRAKQIAPKRYRGSRFVSPMTTLIGENNLRKAKPAHCSLSRAK